MVEAKEQGLLDNLQDNAEVLETTITDDKVEQTEVKDKEKPSKTQKKEAQVETSTNPTNLESFKQSLKPQEKKVLENFMASSVYDSFMSYLETFFREKDTLIHRINCYCFKSLEDFSLRIQGKIYEIKKGQIIYIQKDSFGNSLLRNNKLERIM